MQCKIESGTLPFPSFCLSRPTPIASIQLQETPKGRPLQVKMKGCHWFPEHLWGSTGQYDGEDSLSSPPAHPGVQLKGKIG